MTVSPVQHLRNQIARLSQSVDFSLSKVTTLENEKAPGIGLVLVGLGQQISKFGSGMATLLSRYNQLNTENQHEDLAQAWNEVSGLAQRMLLIRSSTLANSPQLDRLILDLIGRMYQGDQIDRDQLLASMQTSIAPPDVLM